MVAADVIAEGNDNHGLVAMLDQVADTVGTRPRRRSRMRLLFGEQLQQAEERGYGVLVTSGATMWRPKRRQQRRTIGTVSLRPRAGLLRVSARHGAGLCRHQVDGAGQGRRAGAPLSVHAIRGVSRPVQCSQDPKGRTVSIGRFMAP